jgi:hypothetical protein
MTSTHGERHCQPCIHEERIRTIDEKSDKAYAAIFVNGHPKGSLMTRAARNEEDIQRILDKVDKLPNTILTYLLIAGSLLVILQFLGPSIRKAMGMISMSNPVTMTDNRELSTIPPLAR